jgi:hypothetical protein
MHLDNGTFLGLSRSDAESLAFNAPGKIKNIYRLCFNSLKINICIIVWLHCKRYDKALCYPMGVHQLFIFFTSTKLHTIAFWVDRRIEQDYVVPV